ncbi:MAG: hypothetical protein IPG92_14860 [Flavobacteriales bacterium]|nr:hypothetical protein [Flavobacteriales bacterium]
MRESRSPTREALDQMHNDPSNWRMGVFYYNKMDPRLLPPKRYGWGWTTNFASARSILVMLLLVGAVVALVQALKVLAV